MAKNERIVCRIQYWGDDQDQRMIVRDQPIIIGRSPECDLTLKHESISRRHARIYRNEGGWIIEDLGSKNGIRINTYRATRQLLCDGDRIDLGALRLEVGIGEEAPGAEAQVVFHDDRERGHRAGIIEMERLEAILGPPLDSMPPTAMGLSAGSLVMDGGIPHETGNPLRLFSAAAETLLSCETLGDTLERILALVFNNLPAERGVICLYDEDSDTTTPKVMRTIEGVPDEPIVISSHIANDVIRRKQSLLVHDTMMDERFGGAESVILMKIHSAMCAPLYHGGHVVGFIYTDQQSDKDPFTGPHLQALSTLAVLSAVAVHQAGLRDGIRREQEIRARLARYSSPAVVNRIIEAAGGAEPGMVAEEGEVTVLFADLTGFTAMAERLPASEVVRMLNRVFERLTEAVFAYEGTLDKFRGDGMMAFFGAPLAQPDHAQRAVKAALRMQELIGDLNSYSGDDREIALRIGINSGAAIVGDVGSPQRKDYTAIGDVVNIASRLESFVAEAGQIVIGPQTQEQLGPDYQCEALAEVRLKGKRQSVRPFLVLGRENREEP